MQKIKDLLKDYQLLLDNVPALVTVAFVLSTVWMNTSAGKIIYTIGPVSVTGGFLLSFMPFLCMDVTVKYFGARAAIMLNVLSAVFNFLYVALLSLVAAIPTEADYTAFNSVNGSVWFIVLGSTIAFVVSGVANSLINAAIGKLFPKTSWAEFFSRSAVSTFIGQAIDNFLFMFIVYVIFAPKYWGMSIPVTTCLGTAIAGGFIELICELIFTPFGYKVVKSWEKRKIGTAYLEAHPTE